MWSSSGQRPVCQKMKTPSKAANFEECNDTLANAPPQMNCLNNFFLR